MKPRSLALALFALAALAPATALAQGVLMPTDRALGPLSVKYHRVNVEIENGTAVTKIEQVFKNHTSQQLEATFLFPMPEHAAILEFAMWMNGVKVKGEVLDRGQARAIYEDIVRRMRDPGLIEWAGHTLFRARIFPIPPNGEQKIEIAFTQVLPYEDGIYRYLYPLRTAEAAMRTLEDFTIQAKLHSATPIRNVYSPTHKIYVKKSDDHHATVGFEQEGALLQKDFELLYSISKKDIGLTLMTYRPESGEPGYFLLMAAPKATYAEQEIVGKAVTFVVDTSGSMAEQDKMSRAKAALTYCVERLNPRDTFNIIRFSSDVEAFRPGLVSAESERKAALEFIAQMEPAGGTAIHEALVEALKAKGGVTRPIIVFITDGRPTVGETETPRIVEAVAAANQGGARIFTFGVGETVNTKLLDQIALQYGGTATYVKPDTEIEEKVTSFYNKMSHPVLSDLTVELGAAKPFAVLPKDVPDLFRGDQLLLIGRYRGDGDSLVRLRGKVGAEERTYDFEGVFPGKTDKYPFIAQLWGHRQVGYLLEQIALHGEKPELVDEVKQLAIKFGVVTPYTSYLAVEPGMRPQQRPLASPSGPFAPVRDEEEARRGGFAPTPAPAAAEPSMGTGAIGGAGGGRFWAPAKKGDTGVLRTTDALADESGEKAVERSKAIRELKEQDRAPTERAVRYLRGKVFRWDSGWVDQSYAAALPRLEVKYLSDGYFALLTKVPELKDWLSLGARVTVVYKGVAVIVAETGKETLTDADLAPLTK